MEFGLDEDDSVEQLLDDCRSVGRERGAEGGEGLPVNGITSNKEGW